jgi:WD40 repeat protein
MEELLEIMKLKMPLITSIISYLSFNDKLQLKKLLNKKVTKILLTSKINHRKEFSESTTFPLKYTFKYHSSEICTVVHLKEFQENLLISGGYDNVLCFWDLNDGKCLGSYKEEFHIIREIIYPGKIYQDIVLVRDDSNKLFIYDLREKKVSHIFYFPVKINTVILNNEGRIYKKVIAVSDSTEGLSFIDMLSGNIIATFSKQANKDNFIGYLLYERKDELYHIFECNDEDQSWLLQINVTKLPQIKITRLMQSRKGNLICFIYIKQYNIIVSSKKYDEYCFLELFCLNTNTSNILGYDKVSSIAYDKYSSLLFLKNDNNSVITVDLNSLEKLHEFKNHVEKIPRIIWLKQFEGVFVTCSWDGSCIIFDAKNKKLIAMLDHSKGNSCCVYVTTFTYFDKNYIVSCGSSNNKEIKVWEISY